MSNQVNRRIVESVKAKQQAQRDARSEFHNSVKSVISVQVAPRQVSHIMGKLGWSQAELSRRTGGRVSQQSISALVRGESSPTFRTLELISQALCEGIEETEAYQGSLTADQMRQLLSRGLMESQRTRLLTLLVTSPAREQYKQGMANHRKAKLS
jgi:transcriptional regulator with XRE-family HTH domain